MNIEPVLFLGITQMLVLSKSAKIDGRCNNAVTHVNCKPSEECFLYSPDTLRVKKRSIPDNPGDDGTLSFPDHSSERTPPFPENPGEGPPPLPGYSGEGTPPFPDYSGDGTESIPANHGSRRRAICLDKKAEINNLIRHAHLSIDCPPKKKVGSKPGQVDKLDCEPEIKSVCGTDSDCPWNQICCHDGCWKICTKPMLSRSSP